MTREDHTSTNQHRRTFLKATGIATTGLIGFSGVGAAHSDDDERDHDAYCRGFIHGYYGQDERKTHGKDYSRGYRAGKERCREHERQKRDYSRDAYCRGFYHGYNHEDRTEDHGRGYHPGYQYGKNRRRKYDEKKRRKGEDKDEDDTEKKRDGDDGKEKDGDDDHKDRDGRDDGKNKANHDEKDDCETDNGGHHDKDDEKKGHKHD